MEERPRGGERSLAQWGALKPQKPVDVDRARGTIRVLSFPPLSEVQALPLGV